MSTRSKRFRWLHGTYGSAGETTAFPAAVFLFLNKRRQETQAAFAAAPTVGRLAPNSSGAKDMNCPICSVQLVMTERQGIEIDYCPKCRGVWLDRGELDKIVERSNDEGDDRLAAPPPRPQYPLDKDDSHHGYPYKRKKSWLGELFD